MDGSKVKERLLAESRQSAIHRGEVAAVRLLNERVANGQSRKEAAKALFELSSGESNTTAAENWFDEGLRAQLIKLGYSE